MRTLPLLLAVVLVGSWPWDVRAGETPELTLRVTVSAEFEGTTVRLADIAEPIGEDRALWNEIKDLVVSRADARWITRTRIEKRLLSAGVPGGSIELEGAAICTLRSERDEE